MCIRDRVIPVFCIRDSNYLTVASRKGLRSLQDVTGSVKWKQPVNASNEREVEVEIYCQPERRQPAAKDNMKASDYDHHTDCHPFWHIRRSAYVGEFNSTVVGVDIKVITSSAMKQLSTADYQPTAGVWDFEVTVPCIVNTEKIAGGAEIVLKSEKKD